jgi:putative PEP-CTERM system TPR-repeat lipoprotein
MWLRRCLLAATAAVLLSGCSKSPEQYLESGNKYAAQGKYKEAVVEYRNAIQQAPRMAAARLKLAEAYEHLGDARTAYEQYVRAADLQPENLEAQLKAGAYLFLAQKYQDAAARADAILKKNPKNVDALILKGDTTAMLQDLDGAIRQMEEAIQIDPDEARAYTDLGVMRRQKGDMRAAEEAFRQAIRVEPKSVAARLALANFLMQAGRRNETEAVLREARDIAPTDIRPNQFLALFYLSANRAAEAEPFLKAVVDSTKSVSANLALADYYAGMKRSADAIKLLKGLAGTKEGFAPATTRLAGILYADGRTDEAHKAIESVLAKNPKDDRALVVKSRFLHQESKVDQAIAAAQAAFAANPRSAAAQYALGVAYTAKNAPEAAVTAFNEVLKLNPHATAAQLQIARIELGRGPAGAPGAVHYAEQALSVEPANAVARLMLVRALLLKGELARAQVEFDSLARHYPDAAPVRTAGGMLQLAKKDLAGARQSFEKALTEDARSVDALAGLVAVDFASGRPKDAVARVEARLAQAPSDAEVLVLAARTYAGAGDAARAEQTLLKALDTAPGNLQSYGLLGQLYLQQRKLPQARARFEDLAGHQAKPVGALTMVAMILQMEGNQAEAQKRYEKVMELDPRAPVAANNLAWMYAEQGGNLEMALQLAQTAKAGLPDSPEVNDTLGWIYYRKNLPGLAIGPFQQALDKSPRNPGYLYHLGAAYAKSGETIRARTSLEAALKLSSTFDGATDARRILESLR